MIFVKRTDLQWFLIYKHHFFFILKIFIVIISHLILLFSEQAVVIDIVYTHIKTTMISYIYQ